MRVQVPYHKKIPIITNEIVHYSPPDHENDCRSSPSLKARNEPIIARRKALWQMLDYYMIGLRSHCLSNWFIAGSARPTWKEMSLTDETGEISHTSSIQRDETDSC